MRTSTVFIILSCVIGFCFADFRLREVTGTYDLITGDSSCFSDIHIIRRDESILGGDISGTGYECSGGRIDLVQNPAQGKGNFLTQFLSKHQTVGDFVYGRVASAIVCQNTTSSGGRTFRLGSFVNFIETERDLIVVWRDIFRAQTSLENAGGETFTFKEDSEYLVLGSQCLYEKTSSLCFPSSAKVNLESGDVRRMDEVSVGDRVRVAADEYSEVYMWTHKSNSKPTFNYVQLRTAAGYNVTMTRGHYVYANDLAVPAKEVRVGDRLRLADGRSSLVTATERVRARGYYNPQTLHGDIVVDGIVATTYTTTVEPKYAHALLSPIRMIYGALQVLRSAFITSGFEIKSEL